MPKEIQVGTQTIMVDEPNGFSVTADGVYSGAPEDGNKISGLIYVESILVKDTERLVVIKGTDSATGSFYELVLRRSELDPTASRTTIKKFLDAGQDINPEKKIDVLKYLYAQKGAQVKKAFSKTGWSTGKNGKNIFVLPTTFVGTTADEGTFLPESGRTFHSTFNSQGTHLDWQLMIENHCHGSPLAVFALGAAFAAPLLTITQSTGGGFNFGGDTTRGKTTLLQVAASVWGRASDPDDPGSYVRTWDATINGLEAIAASYNDLLLPMDELAASKVKDFGQVVYQIAGGVGKVAATRDRTLAQERTWKVLLLSSGEIGVLQKIFNSTGQDAKSGQAIRFIDIPVGESAFPGIPENEAPHTISNLKKSCGQYYGTVGIKYLQYLVTVLNSEHGLDDINQQLRNIVLRLENKFPNLQPEQRRAINRFALVGLALLIASKAECVKLKPLQIMDSVCHVISSWFHAFPTLSETDRAFQSIRDYVAIHPRKFGKVSSSGGDTSSGLTGYYCPSSQRYYFIQSKFSEACGGRDPRAVLKALEAKGHLFQNDSENGERRLAAKVNIRGTWTRVFAIEKSFFNQAPTEAAPVAIPSTSVDEPNNVAMVQRQPIPSKPPF